jgi:hypothetical protein
VTSGAPAWLWVAPENPPAKILVQSHSRAQSIGQSPNRSPAEAPQNNGSGNVRELDHGKDPWRMGASPFSALDRIVWMPF